jgi:hypothetical protein
MTEFSIHDAVKTYWEKMHNPTPSYARNQMDESDQFHASAYFQIEVVPPVASEKGLWILPLRPSNTIQAVA